MFAGATPSPEFIAKLRELEREVNAFTLIKPGAGDIRATRIGGEPWWPLGEDRPRCRACNHYLAFMAQIALRDVPMIAASSSLLSFHYCQRCTEAGSMSFGGENLRHQGGCGGLGYDVRIFPQAEGAADGRGVIEPSPLAPLMVELARTVEIPEDSDYPEDVEALAPIGFPDLQDDFDENVGFGFRHFPRCKAGGWPTWVQSNNWPIGVDGKRAIFIGQIDCEVGEKTSWAAGGYAYLFADFSTPAAVGELIIQTT